MKSELLYRLQEDRHQILFRWWGGVGFCHEVLLCAKQAEYGHRDSFVKKINLVEKLFNCSGLISNPATITHIPQPTSELCRRAARQQMCQMCQLIYSSGFTSNHTLLLHIQGFEIILCQNVKMFEMFEKIKIAEELFEVTCHISEKEKTMTNELTCRKESDGYYVLSQKGGCNLFASKDLKETCQKIIYAEQLFDTKCQILPDNVDLEALNQLRAAPKHKLVCYRTKYQPEFGKIRYTLEIVNSSGTIVLHESTDWHVLQELIKLAKKILVCDCEYIDNIGEPPDEIMKKCAAGALEPSAVIGEAMKAYKAMKPINMGENKMKTSEIVAEKQKFKLTCEKFSATYGNLYNISVSNEAEKVILNHTVDFVTTCNTIVKLERILGCKCKMPNGMPVVESAVGEIPENPNKYTLGCYKHNLTGDFELKVFNGMFWTDLYKSKDFSEMQMTIDKFERVFGCTCALPTLAVEAATQNETLQSPIFGKTNTYPALNSLKKATRPESAPATPELLRASILELCRLLEKMTQSPHKKITDLQNEIIKQTEEKAWIIGEYNEEHKES